MPKKWWSIHARTKEAQVHGIDTAEGHINFGNKGVFNTSDEKVVKAIEAHKSEAYSFHDEQLTKAYDSQSWDVVETKNGVALKTLHNYKFGSTPSYSSAWEEFEKRRKDKKDAAAGWKDLESFPVSLPKEDKVKKFFVNKKLSWFFWYWDTINPRYKREIGVRIFGVEFKKEFDE